MKKRVLIPGKDVTIFLGAQKKKAKEDFKELGYPLVLRKKKLEKRVRRKGRVGTCVKAKEGVRKASLRNVEKEEINQRRGKKVVVGKAEGGVPF